MPKYWWRRRGFAPRVHNFVHPSLYRHTPEFSLAPATPSGAGCRRTDPPMDTPFRVVRQHPEASASVVASAT
jgi:hypothetical protein